MTYPKARGILKEAGYDNIRSQVDIRSITVGLEIDVSPIMMDKHAEEIRRLIPSMLVDTMKNEQYILIRKNL